MLKNYFTEDFLNSDGTLDLSAVTDSFSDDRLLIKKFKELELDELKSLFHILITNNSQKALGKIFIWLETQNLHEYDHYKILATIFLKDSYLNTDYLSKFLKTLDPDESISLLPFSKKFDDSGQTHLEQAKYKTTSIINDFKTDLIEQIKFLNQQELTDKANEIQQKLEFHFPDSKTERSGTSANPVKLQQSKDLTFSKVIERNLSFNLRTKKRLNKKTLEKIDKKQKEESAALESMISAWKSFFEKKAELFITQLEFLSPDSQAIYEDILRENDDLDLWTKVELMLKTGREFEGLNLLQSKEKELLDKNTEAVYNYYYYKALFYRQVGMLDEAEKIFKALYEQKQNFRDVNFYLKD